MLECKKDVIKFDSANGIHQIQGYLFYQEGVQPKAMIQISHGMCEYLERYSDFASFLVKQGYLVFGNDHLGHGNSALPEDYGYFAPQDGSEFVVQDLYLMNRKMAQMYPNIPIFLLGHSMGSFMARQYALLYPETIYALILSGTGGPHPLSGMGIVLTKWISALKGGRYRSKLVNHLAFGSFLSKIDTPKTPHDWITRDEEIVQAYASDPRCTFIFTVSAFHELLQVQNKVNQVSWAQKMQKDLPIALFAGDADPVGNYGKGVMRVHEMLKQAGVKDLYCKLYPNARHEILNEINRAEVYQDILNWCEQQLQNQSARQEDFKVLERQ